MKIVIALLIFGLIVLIHELGHFIFAKINGIEVTEFAIGMGPTLIGKQIGSTKYSLKCLPIGGMCMMLGEDTDQNNPSPNAFYSKSVFARLQVVVAGPFFNFILAWLLSIIIIAVAGYEPNTLTKVDSNSPAEIAGLQAGDSIVKIDSDNISTESDIAVHFNFYPVTGEAIEITYIRDGIKGKAVVVPALSDNYALGFSYYANDTACEINGVTENYPLMEAGAKPGDVIIEIDGTEIETGKALAQYFVSHPMTERMMNVVVKRGNEEITLKVTPKYLGQSYKTGLVFDNYREKANFGQVIKYSFVEVRYWIETTLRSVGYLFSGRANMNDVGGPVAIVSTIGQTYDTAKENGTALDVLLNMINICVLLSANLGVMNLLPFPALDGGKTLFLIIEGLKRKPLNRKIEGIINGIGMLLLLALMAVICVKDVLNLFH